ncbi:hypothetical protein [Nocardia neocaledoniensis]|uniref:hypothetical protein n=1 Tax=Nocardia neocaledoniensis TaxID=236511 RepID=UPI00245726FA|nr:hypothetical protein [Nocardia neocaledoniensis]
MNDSRSSPVEYTCPSGRCREGSALLGIVGNDGEVKHVTPVIPVSALFAARAAARGSPEARFRFAEPCAEDACGNWDHEQCGLIHRLTAEDSPDAAARRNTLPVCGIRRTCRWYAQRGAQACSVCVHVVRDTVPADG